jgi:hypothetical protein
MEALPNVPPDWTTVPGTFVRVHGPADRVDQLVRIANHASTAFPALGTRLHLPLGDTVSIYVVETAEEFRDLQPGLPPGWADATAWPGIGAIFLRTPELRAGTDEPIERVLDHELVHVLLGRAFAPDQPPSWLQEGIAQVTAGEFGPEAAQTIASGGPLMHLSQLQGGFPRDPVRARLAYAESADFIGWLGATYGDAAVAELIHGLARHHSMDDAMADATGELMPNVEQAWMERLSDGSPLWISWIGNTQFWWGLGAVSLVGGGILRRRAFKRRMEEREREEQEQLAAAQFGRIPDYGPVRVYVGRA